MTRYCDVATLRAVSTSRDDEGNLVREVTETQAYVNRYSSGSNVFGATRAVRALGDSSNVASKAAGLRADAELSMRSCDYGGQTEVVFRGVEYDVESVADRGEFTRLVLARRLSNG